MLMFFLVTVKSVINRIVFHKKLLSGLLLPRQQVAMVPFHKTCNLSGLFTLWFALFHRRSRTNIIE